MLLLKRECTVSGPIVRVLLLVALFAAQAFADDWPQWFGPSRDGIWHETGILRQLPKEGPQVLWRAKVKAGYTGPAVAGGRVYLMDRIEEKTGEEVDPQRISKLMHPYPRRRMIFVTTPAPA